MRGQGVREHTTIKIIQVIAGASNMQGGQSAPCGPFFSNDENHQCFPYYYIREPPAHQTGVRSQIREIIEVYLSYRTVLHLVLLD